MTGPDRIYVAWPSIGGAGLAFNNPGVETVRTEYIRADLHAAALSAEYERGLRDAVRKPVTFAETEKALETVKREVEPTAGWLTDPLYLAKLFSTIIQDRKLKP